MRQRAHYGPEYADLWAEFRDLKLWHLELLKQLQSMMASQHPPRGWQACMTEAADVFKVSLKGCENALEIVGEALGVESVLLWNEKNKALESPVLQRECIDILSRAFYAARDAFQPELKNERLIILHADFQDWRIQEIVLSPLRKNGLDFKIAIVGDATDAMRLVSGRDECVALVPDSGCWRADLYSPIASLQVSRVFCVARSHPSRSDEDFAAAEYVELGSLQDPNVRSNRAVTTLRVVPTIEEIRMAIMEKPQTRIGVLPANLAVLAEEKQGLRVLPVPKQFEEHFSKVTYSFFCGGVSSYQSLFKQAAKLVSTHCERTCTNARRSNSAGWIRPGPGSSMT